MNALSVSIDHSDSVDIFFKFVSQYPLLGSPQFATVFRSICAYVHMCLTALFEHIATREQAAGSGDQTVVAFGGAVACFQL